jgi:hypothetical protein
MPSPSNPPGNILQAGQQQQQQQPQMPQHVITPNTTSYPQYILRRVEMARRYGMDYQLDNDDIDRIQFNRYKETFKDTFKRNVSIVRRIRHRKPGDKEFSEWLAYYVTDSIWDDAGEEHQDQHWEGVENEPVPQVKYNALREIESVNFDRRRVVYTIPWSEENVTAALKDSLIVPTDMGIGYAPTMGTTDIWSGNELAVFNLQELTEFSYEVLERANHGGYLTRAYGGVNIMLDDEKRKKETEQTLGPNMFDRMPTIQQMKEEIKRREAEEARKKREQQKESRERQAEVHSSS